MKAIDEFSDHINVKLGLDPYAISALVDELATRKIEGEMITGIRQGSALSPASWARSAS